jgi:GINS complex subunit 2
MPLWLALLLKRQKRANIAPPPWLLPQSLEIILRCETEINTDSFSPPPPIPQHIPSSDTISPPFLPTATADASPDYLPYHWLELGEILLDAASDDIVEPDRVRGLMRDLREVRMAKMRRGIRELDGAFFKMNGVGGMEVAEGRAFIGAVVDGLR